MAGLEEVSVVVKDRARVLRVGVVGAALALVLALTGFGTAQEGRRLALRVVSLKASGARAEGDEPRSDPSARPYLPVLKPLGYDYYRGAKGEVQRAGPGEALTFTEALPLGLRARADWKVEGERIHLTLELERPGETPGEVRRVLQAKVESADGQHFVVRVKAAFPDGDLVLLLTAQREAP